MLLVTFNLCKECNNFKKRYSFHLDSSIGTVAFLFPCFELFCTFVKHTEKWQS